MRAKIAVLGPVTKDKIVIRKRYEHISAGGAVYYSGEAFSKLGADVTLIMTLSKKDEWIRNHFSSDIKIIPIYKEETAYFENIYPTKSMDYRIQKAKPVNNPITIDEIKNVDFNRFDYILLGSLASTDFPLDTVSYLAGKKPKLCLAIQGFLRHIEDEKVTLKPIKGKADLLKHIDVVIMNEKEADSLMPGLGHEEICRKVADFGPKEVILTRGSKGSVIYSSSDGKMYNIPAYVTENIVDTTGAGDNYIAGYLMKRLETDNLQECGEFAAMTATLKLERNGPLNKDRIAVTERLKINRFLNEERLLD